MSARRRRKLKPWEVKLAEKCLSKMVNPDSMREKLELLEELASDGDLTEAVSPSKAACWVRANQRLLVKMHSGMLDAAWPAAERLLAADVDSEDD